MVKYIFPILITVSVLCSCTHHYYIQNAQNVPLFKEKNELNGTLAVGGGDEINKVDAQGAYSIADNIGLMGSFMYAEDESSDESSDGGYGFFGDASFGYFYPLNNYFVFETYAGFGFASQHHTYSNSGENTELSTADLTFIKYFIQPSIGLTTNYFDIALSFRLSNLNFTDVGYYPYSGDPSQSYDFSELYYIKRNRDYYLLEPAATLRLGYKSFKFQLQIAHSIFLSKPDFSIADLSMTLGVNIQLRKWNE